MKTADKCEKTFGHTKSTTRKKVLKYSVKIVLTAEVVSAVATAAARGQVAEPVQLCERHGFRYTGERPNLFGTQLLTMAKDVRTD